MLWPHLIIFIDSEFEDDNADDSSQSDYNPFADVGDNPYDEDEGPPPPDESKKSYILLTAPTGKAAKVLGKRTGFTGFTLHQVH